MRSLRPAGFAARISRKLGYEKERLSRAPDVPLIATSLSSAGTPDNGFKTIDSSQLNIVAFAPTPSARMSTEIALNAGLLTNILQANFRS